MTSWAKPGQAVYLRENLSGETVQVGAFDPSLPGTANRMKTLPEGFTKLGIPALLRCAHLDTPWVTVDEVGYLESGMEGYQQAFRTLLENKQVAAVVRKQPLAFLQELCSRKDAFVVDLDDPFGKIGCVIMASGLGRRFGSNKLLADFGGEPMICRILDATEGIFRRRVVVTRHEEIARLVQGTRDFGGPSLASQPQRHSAAGFAGDGGDGPLSVCTGRSTAATQGDGSGVGTGVQRLTILLAVEL